MADDPIIRPATAADLPALQALIEHAYRGDGARGGWTHEADLVAGERLQAGELVRSLADPHTRLLLCEGADGLIGCVRVERSGEGPVALGLLTVDPRRQAAGLGRRLLAAGEAAARELGAAGVEMTVIDARPELIAWYERRGYRATGERRPFPVPTLTPVEFVVLERAVG